MLATPAGPAVFPPSTGGQTSPTGQLLFFRANALMLQPFNLQTLQLTGEPRSVAEPVGTFLDRAVFSATPTTLVYTAAAGALDVQLRWPSWEESRTRCGSRVRADSIQRDAIPGSKAEVL